VYVLALGLAYICGLGRRECPKHWLLASSASRGGNGKVRIPVDICHQGGLLMPIVGLVLDYAKAVDPEVADAEPIGHTHSVLEQQRQ